MKNIIKTIIIILPIIMILIFVVWDIFIREYFCLEVNDNNFQEVIEILEKDGFNTKKFQNPSIIKVKINEFMRDDSDEYRLEYYDINGNRIGGGDIKELDGNKYAIINYLQTNTLDIFKLQNNLFKISVILSFITMIYSLIIKIKRKNNSETNYTLSKNIF